MKTPPAAVVLLVYVVLLPGSSMVLLGFPAALLGISQVYACRNFPQEKRMHLKQGRPKTAMIAITS